MSGRICATTTDPRFDPPHSTVQANMISGGSATNILAREALVTWEYRALPDRDAGAIVDTVKRRTREEILPNMRGGHRTRRSTRNCSPPIPAWCWTRIRLPSRSPAKSPAPTASKQWPMAPKPAIPARRNPRRDLRPRLHRPGPQARRILRTQRIRGLREFPAQGDREGGELTPVVIHSNLAAGFWPAEQERPPERA